MAYDLPTDRDTEALAAALAQLDRPAALSILKLAQPILEHADGSSTSLAKDPNHNEDNSSAASPAILAADLAHYRDLFSKLRFSYVEQVTKERFLRALCAEQPDFTSAAENSELEQRLRADKAQLKAKKVEVAEMIAALEAQGRALAARHERVVAQTAQLHALPAENAQLTEQISALRARLVEREALAAENPDLALPLPQMRLRKQEREAELRRVEREIAQLQGAGLPERQAEAQRLREELAPLQARRKRAEQEAQEARRRRDEGGGMADELEEQGRWLRGVKGAMEGMLEV